MEPNAKRKKTGPKFMVRLNPKEVYESVSILRGSQSARRYALLSARFGQLGKKKQSSSQLAATRLEPGEETPGNSEPKTKINRLGWKIDATNLNNLQGEDEDDKVIFNSEDIKRLALEGPLLSGVKGIDETNKHLFYNRCLLRDHMETLNLSVKQRKARSGMLIDHKMKFIEMMDRDILAHKKSLNDRWSTMPAVYEKNVFTPARQLPVPSSPEPEFEFEKQEPVCSDQKPSEVPATFCENQFNTIESDELYVSFENGKTAEQAAEPGPSTETEGCWSPVIELLEPPPEQPEAPKEEKVEPVKEDSPSKTAQQPGQQVKVEAPETLEHVITVGEPVKEEPVVKNEFWMQESTADGFFSFESEAVHQA